MRAKKGIMEGMREVERTFPAAQVSDGGGVKINRSLGMPDLSHHDPFLLLDCFGTEDPEDYIAGFPPHPHRGFETVTYMLAGHMEHRDSEGHRGDLRTGGVQWMTAGRGVIHSEMPQQAEGEMRGFQLWINLPSSRKMDPPSYRNIEPAEIPVKELENGIVIKAVAGSAEGITGPVKGIATDPVYLDVFIPAGTEWEYSIPDDHNAMAYPFEGAADFCGVEVPRHTLAIFGKGEGIKVRTRDIPARFLLLAAKPIGEEIARSGPFVMNTREELMQAYEDYRTGKLAPGL